MTHVTIKPRNSARLRDGRSTLYAFVRLKDVCHRFSIGLAVYDSEWDQASERIRGRSSVAYNGNLLISDVKAKISDTIVKIHLKGLPLTRENFTRYYSKGIDTDNFYQFATGRLKELMPGLQFETYRHHKVVLEQVRDYNPDLLLSDITPEWLKVYSTFLRTKVGNNPGTINKKLSIIRSYFYGAMRAGKIDANPFEHFKLPTPDPQVVYLSEDELSRFTALYTSQSLNQKEHGILRLFLFMTFTAMHFSDVQALKIEQIYDGEIHYRRRKTHTRVNIPVSVPAAKLIEEYRCGRSRGTLVSDFPANQTFNYEIKKISRLLKINKPVSAKTARHTFATLYYKKNQGDVGTLSKLLGHTSITTTMIYAHIMKDSRVAGIAAFNDML